MELDTWVLARDSNGVPDLVALRLDCTEQELLEGLHYERAIARVAELGYEPLGAFCERDPAGLRLMSFEGWRKQQRAPGDASQPLWAVPLTVDMSLSATVRAHGGTARQAIANAREFAASPEGFGLFSLDEGNYRGPSDFYCGDPDAVELVQHFDAAAPHPVLESSQESSQESVREPVREPVQESFQWSRDAS